MEIKTKGTVGELKVKTKLLENGFNVYENINDINGIDLVAEKDNKYISIQVKASYSKNEISKGYGFRFGNCGNVADYTICVINDLFYIIPKHEMKQTGLTLFPDTQYSLSKYHQYFDKWNI